MSDFTDTVEIDITRENLSIFLLEGKMVIAYLESHGAKDAFYLISFSEHSFNSDLQIHTFKSVVKINGVGEVVAHLSIKLYADDLYTGTMTYKYEPLLFRPQTST